MSSPRFRPNAPRPPPRERRRPLDARGAWWAVLDYFEERRSRRVALVLAIVLLGGGLAAWHWGYPHWARRNAIRVAQQWLEVGNLRNAAEAAQRAGELAPERPEPWSIAAELARRGGQHGEALRFSRRAAELAPQDPDLAIALAAAALRAGDPTEATASLQRVAAPLVTGSAAAQRVLGELARRELRLTEARAHFENAVRLEGRLPRNEIPLGTVLLQSRDPAVRQQGVELLTRHAADATWGLTALRTLVGDGVDRQDRETLERWTDAFRQHAGFTVGDMPLWLLALMRIDESRYVAARNALERDHAVSPAAAAQLVGWLNQVGRAEDAVAWMQTLPAAAFRRPPLVALGAESLRATGRWRELREWLDASAWEGDTAFLRWVYGVEAARRLGEETRAAELLQTLDSHAQLDTGHALFAASTLYSWGRTAEAEALWWRAAGQEGANAIAALGALARHYQVARDAGGQYRVFRRWHGLQPNDADVANNFAFFALLTEREQRLAEDVARQNLERAPANDSYAATLAFALARRHRATEALALLETRKERLATSPALAFSQGIALAVAGRPADARALLEKLPPASLTVAEVELIRRSLEE